MDFIVAIPQAALVSAATLGVLLVVAAIFGQPISIGKIVLPGTRNPWERLGAGSFGSLLIALAVVGISGAGWNTAYNTLVDSAAGRPPPPMPIHAVEARLEMLADQAGSDIRRNCLLAGFIRDFAIDPPTVIALKLQKSTRSSDPALSCYRDVAIAALAQVNGGERLASAAATPQPDSAYESAALSNQMESANQVMASAAIQGQNRFLKFSPETLKHATRIESTFGGLTSTSVSSAQVRNIAGPDSAAAKIAAALTTTGAAGWIYLGAGSIAGLHDGRTVREVHPIIDGIVHIAEQVNLHADGQSAHPRSMPIIGVLRVGDTARVRRLTGGAEMWADITLIKKG